MRALRLVAVAVLLAGCSWGGVDEQQPAPAPEARVGGDDLAANTPADLRHPCQAVRSGAAGEILGGEVTRQRERTRGRTLRCRFVVTARPTSVSAVEIRSAPDLTSLSRRVGLYLGADRLPHHPVDLLGADGAEAVIQPVPGIVTLFVKQGFVTHVVVVHSPDTEVGEAAAADLAGLVLRANG